ncbi:MAG: alpha/beta fold hydrolase [Deltaproteobacteria bacterium]|nr:alpha/beta fold hydrolase [Deltaproteobacteria bacterium]
MRLSFVFLLAFGTSAACSGEQMYRVAIGWERYRAALKAKVVHAADHDVHYLEARPAATPGHPPETLVFLHGFGADKDSWLRLFQAFEGEHHIISLDLPGFGDSSRDMSKPYDVAAQVQRVRAILQSLSISRAHFVGSSMGGAIAALYALTFPGEVASLCLIDAAGLKAPRRAKETLVITEGDNPLVIATEAEFDRLIAVNFVTPPSIPSSIKRYFIARAAEHHAFTQKVFADLRRNPVELSDRLPEIAARTLILWGDHDRVIDPSVGEAYAAGINGSKLVVLKDTGHAPQLERPLEVARELERFLDAK